MHIACLFRRHTIHPSVLKCWLHGSLKILTTLSFHVQIGARKTVRLSSVFFRRGNIVAYEVYPRRDHCWLKTLPNTPPGWLEIQSALAIFVGLLGGLVTCWKKSSCVSVSFTCCEGLPQSAFSECLCVLNGHMQALAGLLYWAWFQQCFQIWTQLLLKCDSVKERRFRKGFRAS